jgi:hypothetical protein
MLSKILNARVSCTTGTIVVGGAEKTCKNWMDGKGVSQILCNYDRFMKTADSDQYVLIHHEYAGLAGFEPSNGSDSEYEISNQISGYLVDEVVKKLAVNPNRANALKSGFVYVLVTDPYACGLLVQQSVEGKVYLKWVDNPKTGYYCRYSSAKSSDVMYSIQNVYKCDGAKCSANVVGTSDIAVLEVGRDGNFSTYLNSCSLDQSHCKESMGTDGYWVATKYMEDTIPRPSLFYSGSDLFDSSGDLNENSPEVKTRYDRAVFESMTDCGRYYDHCTLDRALTTISVTPNPQITSLTEIQISVFVRGK